MTNIYVSTSSTYCVHNYFIYQGNMSFKKPRQRFFHSLLTYLCGRITVECPFNE